MIPAAFCTGSLLLGQHIPYAHMSILCNPKRRLRDCTSGSFHTGELNSCSKRNWPPRLSCLWISCTQNFTCCRAVLTRRARSTGVGRHLFDCTHGGQANRSSGHAASSSSLTSRCVCSSRRSHPCPILKDSPVPPCALAFSAKHGEQNSSATAV